MERLGSNFQTIDMLAKQEFQRYLKQILLDDIGLMGQNRLKDAKIAVIGAGGLGCPVLQYLCSTGIGHLGLIDFDTVDESNLHRQILYRQEDIGLKKVQAAFNRLSEQNPNTVFSLHDEVISSDNAAELLKDYDLIVDGCDNFATRYAVNDACLLLNKPLIYGSILGYTGQLAGFNIDGSGNLRDVFPEPPNPEDVPSCSENGVLGTVPGIIGTIMAQMAIDVVLGRFDFKNKFILMDTRSLQRTVLDIG